MATILQRLEEDSEPLGKGLSEIEQPGLSDVIKLCYVEKIAKKFSIGSS